MGVFNWIARVFGSGRQAQPTSYGPVAPINEILPNSINDDFEYPIIYVPGPPNHNARRNRNENDAALPMTQGEYNKLINKYNGMTNLPPDVRRNMGMTEVLDNPKWVPNQNDRPKRELTPSSSLINNIKLTPDNKIKLTYGPNSKEYTFNGGSTLQEAAQAVLELINSPSIGRAVNSRIPGSWGRRHFDSSMGTLPPEAHTVRVPGSGSKYRKT
jgi:hypothetical protein